VSDEIVVIACCGIYRYALGIRFGNRIRSECTVTEWFLSTHDRKSRHPGKCQGDDRITILCGEEELCSQRAASGALKKLRVVAIWDGEADVWVAMSADVIGLIAEAKAPEDLIGKLQDVFATLSEDDPQLIQTYDRFDIMFIRGEVAPLTRGA
jgi:predicted RNase H-like HicB family nuclease